MTIPVIPSSLIYNESARKAPSGSGAHVDGFRNPAYAFDNAKTLFVQSIVEVLKRKGLEHDATVDSRYKHALWKHCWKLATHPLFPLVVLNNKSGFEFKFKGLGYFGKPMPLDRVFTDNEIDNYLNRPMRLEEVEFGCRYRAKMTNSPIVRDTFDEVFEDERNAIVGSWISLLKSQVVAPTMTYDQRVITGNSNFVGDAHAALSIMINRQANLIASRTRIGPGNRALVSPIALDILQSATTAAFSRNMPDIAEHPFVDDGRISYAGLLNNSVRVFVDSMAHVDDSVIIWYENNEIERCPFVYTSAYEGVIEDENGKTVQRKSGFTYRDASLNAMGIAADYAGLIGINPETLVFG